MGVDLCVGCFVIVVIDDDVWGILGNIVSCIIVIDLGVLLLVRLDYCEGWDVDWVCVDRYYVSYKIMVSEMIYESGLFWKVEKVLGFFV